MILINYREIQNEAKQTPILKPGGVAHTLGTQAEEFQVYDQPALAH
jgi:hypothetical protein